MKKILFITQNLERTGSEMVLWYLFNNLDKSKYEIHVFCMEKGSLYNLLPSHIGKSVVYKKSGSLKQKLWRTVLKTIGINPLSYQLTALHNKFKPDYWYVNTLVIPWVYQVAKTIKVDVVTHVHELLQAFTIIKRNDFKLMVEESKVIIGCSEQVCEHFRVLGHEDVRLQSSFIDASDVHIELDKVEALKRKHGIGSRDFVWVISGGTSYMKGFDLLVSLLKEFQNPNIKFLWIGKQRDDGLNYYIEELARSKYPNQLIFAGAQSDDYYNYMATGNGLLLLSREESFSLVTVEAAFLGLPTVGFGVGITKSFLKEGMGETVGVGDLEGLMLVMEKWHTHTVDKALLKTEALVYDVEHQISRYHKLLDEL